MARSARFHTSLWAKRSGARGGVTTIFKNLIALNPIRLLNYSHLRALDYFASHVIS
jgi:hypothetical protein